MNKKAIRIGFLMFLTSSTKFKRVKRSLLYSTKKSYKISTLYLAGKCLYHNVFKKTIKLSIRLKEFFFVYTVFCDSPNIVYTKIWHKRKK